MNESSKTIAYVVTAAVLVLAGWWVNKPSVEADSTLGDVGQQFFPDFTDPLTAKTLEIIEYDEEEAAPKVFRVTQVKGVWSLPSHENYPADADRQLAEAAASVMDLEKLAVVTDNPGEHELYGVIDPQDAGAGAEGVGMKVTLEDGAGKKVAQFIIGKEVPDQPSLHFVRIPTQDRVYRVEVDTGSLSTDFADWIEPDLLKLNQFDIERVVVNDHSVDELNQALLQRGRFAVALQDNEWELLQLQRYQQGGWRDQQVPEGKQLNEEQLNAMKTALDDLEIVDVARKPAGLSGNLRAGEELLNNVEAITALRSRGFYAAQVPGSQQLELFSNEGEIRCGMSTGVEYVLRFGAIAGRDSGGKSDAAEAGEAAEGAEGEAAADGLTRYLFVMAEFNQDLIEKPEPPKKQEPAAEPTEPAPADAAPADAAPADAAPAEQDGAPEETTEPAPEQQPQSPPAETQESSAEEESGDSTEQTPSAGDDCQAGDAEPAESADDAPAEEPASEPGQQPAADPAEEPAAEPAPQPEDDPAEVEYLRLMQEYEEKVKAGQETVKTLNDRFADWFYVIDEETYTKIHLNTDELLVDKPAEEEPAEAGAAPAGEADLLQQFDALRQEGIDE